MSGEDGQSVVSPETEVSGIDSLASTYARMATLVNIVATDNDERLHEYNYEINTQTKRIAQQENRRKELPSPQTKGSIADDELNLSSAQLVNELSGLLTNEFQGITLEVTGLDDEEMHRNHLIFSAIVERAKKDGHKRIDKLIQSYEQLRAHQQQIMKQSIENYKQVQGFHRLKNRILELDNQLSKQRLTLNEKKYQYQLRKAESNQSAEELRTRYEAETEELIRNLLATIDTKQKEQEVLQQRFDGIKREIDRICKDLSVLLYELEREEKNKSGRRNTRRQTTNQGSSPTHRAPSNNDLQRSESKDENSAETNPEALKKKAEEASILDVFPFLKVGELTEEMLQQTYLIVDESAVQLQGKRSEREYAEQKLAAKKAELNSILKSEESKALDRLKKMTTGLETKIDSDEKRAALLEMLIKNLEKDQAGDGKNKKSGLAGGGGKGVLSGVNVQLRRQRTVTSNANNSSNNNSNNNSPSKPSKGTSSPSDNNKNKRLENRRSHKLTVNDSDDDDDGEKDADEEIGDEIARQNIRRAKRRPPPDGQQAADKKRVASAGGEAVTSPEGADGDEASSSSLSFGTQDSQKFQALQAKYLQSSQRVRQQAQRQQQQQQELLQKKQQQQQHRTSPSLNSNGNLQLEATPYTYTRTATNLKATSGKPLLLLGSPVEDSEQTQTLITSTRRYVAPQQMAAVFDAMEMIEGFIKPPAWALGPSNVLVPYSQTPVTSTAASNPPTAISPQQPTSSEFSPLALVIGQNHSPKPPPPRGTAVHMTAGRLMSQLRTGGAPGGGGEGGEMSAEAKRAAALAAKGTGILPKHGQGESDGTGSGTGNNTNNNHSNAEGKPVSPNTGLMIKAKGLDVPHHQSTHPHGHPTVASNQPAHALARQEQLLLPTSEERARLRSRAEKAQLAADKEMQEYFYQSYGFHLALEQLQTFLELLTHWGANAPENTSAESMKEVLYGNQSGAMVLRTEEEELEDLEKMRVQTQEVLTALKQAYKQNKNIHLTFKEVQRDLQAQVRRCDETKRQLFHEIEGMNWGDHLQPGQYQQEMDTLKSQITALKQELRGWEERIRVQSKTNTRLSHALTDEKTARKITEGIAEKLRLMQQQQRSLQSLQSAGAGKGNMLSAGRAGMGSGRANNSGNNSKINNSNSRRFSKRGSVRVGAMDVDDFDAAMAVDAFELQFLQALSAGESERTSSAGSHDRRSPPQHLRGPQHHLPSVRRQENHTHGKHRKKKTKQQQSYQRGSVSLEKDSDEDEDDHSDGEDEDNEEEEEDEEEDGGDVFGGDLGLHPRSPPPIMTMQASPTTARKTQLFQHASSIYAQAMKDAAVVKKY